MLRCRQCAASPSTGWFHHSCKSRLASGNQKKDAWELLKPCVLVWWTKPVGNNVQNLHANGYLDMEQCTACHYSARYTAVKKIQCSISFAVARSPQAIVNELTSKFKWVWTSIFIHCGVRVRKVNRRSLILVKLSWLASVAMLHTGLLIGLGLLGVCLLGHGLFGHPLRSLTL